MTMLHSFLSGPTGRASRTIEGKRQTSSVVAPAPEPDPAPLTTSVDQPESPDLAERVQGWFSNYSALWPRPTQPAPLEPAPQEVYAPPTPDYILPPPPRQGLSPGVMIGLGAAVLVGFMLIGGGGGRQDYAPARRRGRRSYGRR